MKWMLAIGVIFLGIICLGGADGDTIIVDDDGGAWADYTRIQDAIDNAANGDRILVYNGTYNESLIIEERLEILGNGSSDTIIDINKHGSVITIKHDHVSIDGLSITGTKCCAGYLAGVKIEDYDNCVISNLSVYNISGDGIRVYGDDNEISNCTVTTRITGTLIHVKGDWNLIDKCHVFNNKHTSGCGIRIEGENVTLRNTTVSNIGFTGLSIQGKRITIDHCQVNETKNYGIYIYQSERVRLTSCELFNTSNPSLWPYSVAIYYSTNCSLSNVSSDGGVNLFGSEMAYYSTHTFSSVFDNGREIQYITNATGLSFGTDNRPLILINVTDSTISSITISNVGNGIQMGFCSNVTVDNCKIRDITFYGIVSFYSDNISVRSSTFESSGTSVHHKYSNFCSLFNVTVNGSNYGLDLDYSDSNTMFNVSISGCNSGGLAMANCDNSDLRYLNISRSRNSLSLTGVSNMVEHIKVSDDKGKVWFNGDNVIRNINVVNCSKGVHLGVGEMYDFQINDSSHVGLSIWHGYVHNGSIRNNGDDGVHLDQYSDIENVTIVGNHGLGILMVNGGQYSRISDCVIDNNGGGIFVEYKYNCMHDYYIENVTITANNGTGIDLSPHAREFVIRDCTLANNTGFGIRLDDGQDGVIENCSIFDSGLQGLVMEGGYCRDNVVRHCRIRNNNLNDSIVLDECQEISIIDCSLREGLYLTGRLNEEWFDMDDFDTHFFQNVTVRGKPLIYITGENGINPQTEPGQIIVVDSSDIRIEGMTMTDVSVGIQIISSRDIRIIDSEFSNNFNEGITLVENKQVFIDNCTFNNNSYMGLLMTHHDDVHLGNCTVRNNSNDGMRITYSSDLRIYNNTIIDSGSDGIEVHRSNEILVIKCNISDNRGHGSRFMYCNFIGLTNNTIVANSGNGVQCNWTDHLVISKCNISSDADGILLQDSPENSIIRNLFYNNSRFGISIGTNSSSNFIHHNTFVDNGNDSQAFSHDNNSHWDDGSEGNYWSSYDGADDDSDGIGDTPFSLAGPLNETDHYPLMEISGSRVRTELVVDDSDGSWADHSTVQSAVENATAGTIIHVFSGKYDERVEVDKHVTIIGNGSDSTIIDGEGIGSVLTISSHYVTLEGLSFTGSGGKISYKKWYGGISIAGSWYTTVLNCSSLENDGAGLVMEDSDHCLIAECNFSINEFGVYSRNCDMGRLINLTTDENTASGIELWHSNGLGIRHCRAYHNDEHGIHSWYSENLIFVNISTAFNEYGFRLVNASNSNIRSCVAGFNDWGIHIGDTDYLLFMNNTVHNSSKDGIRLYGGHHEGGGTRWTDVIFNDIQNNDGYGVNISGYVYECSVHHNNFYNNDASPQAVDDGYDNDWDDGEEGNYWSDYNGTDTDGDGIGDTPYEIDGRANATDRYPLMEPVTIDKERNRRPVATIASIEPNPARKGENVSFQGHGSDIDGNITLYGWRSSIDGDFYKGTLNSTIKNNLSVGDHTIYFRVMDDNYAWSRWVTREFTIEPPANTPPTAMIVDIYPINAEEGDNITFIGKGVDDDGNITRYVWRSSIDGEFYEGMENSTVINNLSLGDHIIYFRVMDNNGTWSGWVTLELTIEPPANTPPTAMIVDIYPINTEEGDNITFTGKGMDDDGNITRYVWRSSIDGVFHNATINKVNSTSLSVGAHSIGFRVMDDDGAWSLEVFWSLVVNPKNNSNQEPTGEIVNVHPDPSRYGINVTFIARGNDTDGHIVRYLWLSSIDGIFYNGTSNITTHGALSGGNHTISLHVMDDNGSWSEGVNISLIVNRPPVLSVPSDQQEKEVNGTVIISGTTSDPDGTVVRVEVSIDNGSWHVANGTTNWTFEWDTTDVEDGTHTIRVRSYDGYHYSGDTEFNLTVNNTGLVGDEGSEGHGQMTLYVSLLGVIFISAVIALFVLHRRKFR